jgi:hypothetical protein
VPQSGWNRQLVVYAPGYVPPRPAPLPPVVPPVRNLDINGLSLPLLVQSQGFAFATTGYRQDGLAILEGADDIRELVARFKSQHGAPEKTFVTGVSEGGLVAALLLEQSVPDEYSGGLAACGPVGSFRGQINYVGDFRVLFDYFFPMVIPGTAVDVPFDVVRDWFTIYRPRVVSELENNPARAVELMRTAGAAYDPANFETIVETAKNVLTYNVLSGTDAENKLGGNPYGNQLRWYSGSSNDLRLNFRVQRFAATPAAVAKMSQYETSGRLNQPLITLHTRGDEVMPFWHEPLYLAKVFLSGHSGLLPLPIYRYGHCNFTAQEVGTAFALMVR